jgi:hypothetical protein
VLLFDVLAATGQPELARSPLASRQRLFYVQTDVTG